MNDYKSYIEKLANSKITNEELLKETQQSNNSTNKKRKKISKILSINQEIAMITLILKKMEKIILMKNILTGTSMLLW